MEGGNVSHQSRSSAPSPEVDMAHGSTSDNSARDEAVTQQQSLPQADVQSAVNVASSSPTSPPSTTSSSPPLDGSATSHTTTAQTHARQHDDSEASSHSPSSSPPHSNRRVKLYRLQDDAWIDLGTGSCSVVVVDSPSQFGDADSTATSTEGRSKSASSMSEEGAYIVVTREDASTSSSSPTKQHSTGADNADSDKNSALGGDAEGTTTTASTAAASAEDDIILRTKVMPYPPGYSSDDDEFDLLDDDQDGSQSSGLKNYDLGGYQRQQDTLIVWTDPSGVEMALSFATPVGCAEIWEFIRTARKWAQEMPATSPSPSPSMSSPQPFPHYNLTSVPTKLPEPTLGNIAEVEHAIRAMSRTTVGRERTASMIAKTQVIQKLIKVHEEAEDLESLEDLHALCRVMQMILLLNDNVVFDLILRDSVILGVVSILEYDPEFPTMKASYREHLANPSHFTEVVPIRNAALLAKIHQTHRLHYLKDVVLARILEESTFSMLNSAIYFNEVDIVNEVASDGPFLKELFAIFDPTDDDDDERETVNGVSRGNKTATARDKGKSKMQDAPDENMEGLEAFIGPIPPSSTSNASSLIGPRIPPTLDDQHNDPSSSTSHATESWRQGAWTSTEGTSDHARPAATSPKLNGNGNASASTSTGVSDRRHDAILFLQQFASMAKNLQLPLRAAFFRSLADRGLLRVLEQALKRKVTREDPTIRGAAVAILMTLVDHDPNNVRAYSLRQKAANTLASSHSPHQAGSGGIDGTSTGKDATTSGNAGDTDQNQKSKTLMALLIELFHTEEDLGLKAQMSEALRVLVDAGGEGGPLEAPPRVRQEDPEAEKFLQYFYDDCATTLFSPILNLPDCTPTDPPLTMSASQVALCGHLCDLLCFFISHHTFRSKYFVLSSTLGTHIPKLFQLTRHKHLRLAALRVLRAIVAKNDDFYNRFLMKADLFKPALELAWGERKRDNLLLSACLELFEYVRTSNPRAVINYLMDRHGTRVRQLASTPLRTFELLISKWEQNNEPPPVPSEPQDNSALRRTGSAMGGGPGSGVLPASSNGPTSKSMMRENSTSWSRMDLEDDDEKYFNGSDDDDDQESQVQTKTPAAAGNAEVRSSQKRSASDRSGPTRVVGSLVQYSSDDEDDDESAAAQQHDVPAGSTTSEPSTYGHERAKRVKLDDGEHPEQSTAVQQSGQPADHSDLAGGFIREDTASESTVTSDSEPTLPLPPLRKKAEHDDEDDGRLGLLAGTGSGGAGSTAATTGSNGTTGQKRKASMSSLPTSSLSQNPSPGVNSSALRKTPSFGKISMIPSTASPTLKTPSSTFAPASAPSTSPKKGSSDGSTAVAGGIKISLGLKKSSIAQLSAAPALVDGDADISVEQNPDSVEVGPDPKVQKVERTAQEP